MIGDIFRNAGSVKEFYDELESLRKNSAKILLWQTDNDDNRNKFYGIMKSYLANKVKTSINVLLDEEIAIDQKKPIFIYVEDLGLLFKGSFESFLNNNLKIIADDKVFLKEKRDTPRLTFTHTKVTGDIVLEGKINFNNVKIKDISELGLGLSCNEKLMKGLKVGLKVELTSIYSISLPKPILGTITHKSKPSKHNKIKSGFYQIGVQFEASSNLIKTVMGQLNSEG